MRAGALAMAGIRWRSVIGVLVPLMAGVHVMAAGVLVMLERHALRGADRQCALEGDCDRQEQQDKKA